MFQSTRPHGARPYIISTSSISRSFNPRARTGRDHTRTMRPANGLFQSTRPHGARHTGCPYRIPGKSFNPRARTGRDKPGLMQSAKKTFQSTRPHGARPAKNVKIKMEVVSIHAPARGATRRGHEAIPGSCFNPRARTGRDKSGARITSKCMFQSTRPHGARLPVEAAVYHCQVSIHAPARGATGSAGGLPQRFRFNPRARTGRDGGTYEDPAAAEFQSTRPHGARQCAH